MAFSNIILASGSPRRKLLLQQIIPDFKVICSRIDEVFDRNSSPPEIVQNLARDKAMAVADTFNKGPSLIIGADTIVVLHNRILEKPVDTAQARSMLRSLSNSTHQVYTGVALIKSDNKCNITASTTFFEQTDVTFGSLDEDEIANYIESGSPMDKAGGYGIQDDKGALFIQKINGDYYNVVGFPLFRFYKTIKEFAPELIPLIRS